MSHGGHKAPHHTAYSIREATKCFRIVQLHCQLQCHSVAAKTRHPREFIVLFFKRPVRFFDTDIIKKEKKIRPGKRQSCFLFLRSQCLPSKLNAVVPKARPFRSEERGRETTTTTTPVVGAAASAPAWAAAVVVRKHLSLTQHLPILE